MKFDPISKRVYTDNGKFLKNLNCPYQMTWDHLKEIHNKNRLCTICCSMILETKNYSDQELVEILEKNEETCLKINLNQNNLRVISDGIIEKK